MNEDRNETRRRDHERLDDILAAIERIDTYRGEVSLPETATTDQGLVRDAVLYNLVIIGEAVGALSSSTRESEPGIPWTKIKGLGDLLKHAYFHVQMDRIWEIVESSLPDLRQASERLARDLPGGAFR